jgi:HlyD family secretion protein
VTFPVSSRCRVRGIEQEAPVVKKTFIWIIAIVVVIAALGGVRAAKGRNKAIPVEMEEAKRGELKLTVSATETGTVKAKTEVLVIPRVSGKLVRLLVEEGDRVSKGQVIARLDDEEVAARVRQTEATLASALSRSESAREASEAQPQLTEAAIAQAEAALKAAEYNLAYVKRGARQEEIAAAEARVNEAQATAQEAEKDLERVKALYDKGWTSGAEVDAAQRQHDVAESQLESAKQNYDLTRDMVTPEEQAKAESQVAQAEAAWEQAKANAVQCKLRKRDYDSALASARELRSGLDAMRTQQAYYTVRAPVGGVVSRLNVKEGEFVVGGTSFGLQAQQLSMMTIVDEESLWVEALISEADIPRVEIGQRVEVSCDAYPEKTFTGVLTEVSPAAIADKQNVRTFNSKVLLLDAKGFLKPGMSAEIEIVTDVKKGVLLVPTQAVMERFKENPETGKEDKTYEVYTVKGGKAKKVEISVGDKNWEKTEVVKGLKAGDTVVATVDTKGLKDGARAKRKPKEEDGGSSGGD